MALLLLLNVHLLVLAALLQSVLDPAEEDEVELADVLLVADGELVAVVVDDGGEEGGGVDVLAVGGDEVAEELFELLDESAAGELPLELAVLLGELLDLFVPD